MFLHLGGEVIVPSAEVIGVFDVNTTKAQSTRDFLRETELRSMHITVTEGQPIKTFVITKDKVYLSPIKVSTLRKRSNLLTKSRFT